MKVQKPRKTALHHAPHRLVIRLMWSSDNFEVELSISIFFGPLETELLGIVRVGRVEKLQTQAAWGRDRVPELGLELDGLTVALLQYAPAIPAKTD